MIPISPVHVWESSSTRRVISDVETAARFMLEKWPPEHAGHPLYLIAQQAALSQLDVGKHDIAFDNLFASACAAAGILADAPARTTALPGHVARPWDFRRKRKR